MKKTVWIVALVMGVTAAGRAQFFKKMVENVKQTVQNRANGKANGATNKVLDKADSATRIGGGSSGGSSGGSANGSGLGIDTSSTNRVLGAFARAAQQNPNDTSAADLTMKALGILVGGGGVSAADSAKAINEFRSAKGGSGVTYQMITTITGKMNRKDTSQAWFTAGGEGRMTMTILGSDRIVTIGRIATPTYSITLDEGERNYSLNVIDTSLLNRGAYTVEKLGTETAAGYPCTHVRVTSTTGKGMFAFKDVSELWLSTAMPGYSILRNGVLDKGQQMGMLRALHQAGVDGLLVRMTAGDGKTSMKMELVQIKEGNFPAAMFTIPSGYTQSNETMVGRMITGAARKK
jgi:hypothetical protein